MPDHTYTFPVAHLIQQTWHTAEETNRFLTWFHTTNHEIAFIGRHGRDWEAYLTEKAGGEVPDDWKGVGYLQVYMRERLDDLKTVEEEMRKSSEMISKMDNGSEQPHIGLLRTVGQSLQVW